MKKYENSMDGWINDFSFNNNTKILYILGLFELFEWLGNEDELLEVFNKDLCSSKIAENVLTSPASARYSISLVVS